jgi:hypothetical protein
MKQQIPDPSLRDVLVNLKYETMAATNCHAIGTVTGYQQGSTTFLLDCLINYSKTVFSPGPGGTLTAKQVQYPALVNCPAVVLGGGTTGLQFPIKPGDQCLVLFNDVDMTNWIAGTYAGPTATNRSHSFTDAIALVGFQNVATFDETRALLTNGTAEVGVALTGTQVRIANLTITLGGAIDDLIEALDGFASSLAASGSPASVMAAGAALETSLEDIKPLFDGLLE